MEERGGALGGALAGPGDVLPPHGGQVSLLAGRGEGLAEGPAGRRLGLELGHLGTATRLP